MENVLLLTDMDISGAVRGRRLIAQPVEDRDTLAGYAGVPVNRATDIQVSNTVVTEETDISIRRGVSIVGQNGSASSRLATARAGPSTSACMDDNVVDMQQTRELQDCLMVREVGQLDKDFSINVRRAGGSSCSAVDDHVYADLQVLEQPEEFCSLKKKGPISYGEDCDVIQLLGEMPTWRGVFCGKQQVLRCDDGMYTEGVHYQIIPGTHSKGAFGEAAMCVDTKTGKTFMRKTVKSKLSKNEIEVPLMFRGNVGIPEVYGVNIQHSVTEIYQEFAGLSLKNLMDQRSDYTRQLCDPKMVMLLGFQAFATLQKMHSQGVTHQDIKPENLCVDIKQVGQWLIKFIDFGSSQTPCDRVIEGLTNEYLSPESCNLILEIARGKRPNDSGRLGTGLDVWSLALTLLYCLCGYHVMVYMCTGQTRYTETDPVKLQNLRIQSLLKISALKDEEIQLKLIHPSWPDALKTLLINTLRVDPNMRWSAKTAAEFIMRNWILKSMSQVSQVPAAPPTVAAPPQSATAPKAQLAPEEKAALEAKEAPPSPVAASGSMTSAVPSPAAADGVVFRGLHPAKLVLQTQMSVTQEKTIEMKAERTTAQAVKCSSPPSPGCPLSPTSMSSIVDLPSPSQLPDFTDLLSNGTASKKPQRRTRGKQRAEPYHSSSRRGSKHI